MPLPPILIGHKCPAVSTGTGLDRTNIARDVAEESPTLGATDAATGVYTDRGGRQYEAIVTQSVSAGEVCIKENGVEYLTDRMGIKRWSSVPVFDGQYDDPNLVKRDTPVSAVFNTTDPKSLDAYNDLQKGMIPGRPSVELMSVDRQFFEGVFYIFVTYMKVWYRIPIQ